jgi:hypothetical protein
MKFVTFLLVVSNLSFEMVKKNMIRPAKMRRAIGEPPTQTVKGENIVQKLSMIWYK